MRPNALSMLCVHGCNDVNVEAAFAEVLNLLTTDAVFEVIAERTPPPDREVMRCPRAACRTAPRVPPRAGTASPCTPSRGAPR